MKYWIAIHEPNSIEHHDDLIGLPGDRDEDGTLNPGKSNYLEISPGDRVAYYCTSPIKAVIGVSTVSEGPETYADEWKNKYQFKIEPPLGVSEKKIPYKVLVDRLRFFKVEDGTKMNPSKANLKINASIVEIPEEDFNIIESLLQDE